MPAKKIKDDLVIDVDYINNNPNASYQEVLDNRKPVEIFEGFDMGSYHSIETAKGGGGFQATTTIGDTTKFIIGNNRTGLAEIRATGSLADGGVRILFERNIGKLTTFGEPLKIQTDRGNIEIGNRKGLMVLNFGDRQFEVRVIRNTFVDNNYYIEFDDKQNRQRARIELIDY